jgi:hypothetical protein
VGLGRGVFDRIYRIEKIYEKEDPGSGKFG